MAVRPAGSTRRTATVPFVPLSVYVLRVLGVKQRTLMTSGLRGLMPDRPTPMTREEVRNLLTAVVLFSPALPDSTLVSDLKNLVERMTDITMATAAVLAEWESDV